MRIGAPFSRVCATTLPGFPARSWPPGVLLAPAAAWAATRTVPAQRNVTLNVQDSSFVGNRAGYAGGAVALGAQGIDTPGTFTRTLFSGNTSATGGVFYGIETVRFISPRAIRPRRSRPTRH